MPGFLWSVKRCLKFSEKTFRLKYSMCRTCTDPTVSEAFSQAQEGWKVVERACFLLSRVLTITWDQKLKPEAEFLNMMEILIVKPMCRVEYWDQEVHDDQFSWHLLSVLYFKNFAFNKTICVSNLKVTKLHAPLVLFPPQENWQRWGKHH